MSNRNIFKHLFADTPKPQFQFLDLKNPYTSGESCYVAASATLFGVTLAGGGGPVCIQRHDSPGRIKSDAKVVNTHKGKVLDLGFNPFIDNILATASEDCTVAVTEVDEHPEEMKENINKADLVLGGHSKKVHLLSWHPTALNVLASTSWDKTIKLWDVAAANCVKTFETGANTFSLAWKSDGSQLATTTKDKMMKIFDPRTPEKVVAEFECCEGSKSSKVFWADSLDILGLTCFNKMAKRKMRLWDLRYLEEGRKPIHDDQIDQMSSILMPFFDEDTSLLYLAGKGDGSVSFYNGTKNKGFKSISSYRNSAPQKGGCFVPKRALDTTKCEVARFLKLTKDSIIPLSFCVPRKTGAQIFQEDLYPDCFSGKPSMDTEEYLSGKNAEKVTMCMDPAKRGDVEKVTFEKKQTYAELVAENESLKEQIGALQAELDSLKNTE